jgi:hypothetical protein
MPYCFLEILPLLFYVHTTMDNLYVQCDLRNVWGPSVVGELDTTRRCMIVRVTPLGLGPRRVPGCVQVVYSVTRDNDIHDLYFFVHRVAIARPSLRSGPDVWIPPEL